MCQPLGWHYFVKMTGYLPFTKNPSVPFALYCEKGGHTTAPNVTYSLFLVYHYLISSVILCLI